MEACTVWWQCIRHVALMTVSNCPTFLGWSGIMCRQCVPVTFSATLKMWVETSESGNKATLGIEILAGTFIERELHTTSFLIRVCWNSDSSVPLDVNSSTSYLLRIPKHLLGGDLCQTISADYRTFEEHSIKQHVDQALPLTHIRL